MDENAVYRRACEDWQKTARLATRRLHQTIKFAGGPIALVFAADLHLGNAGVDYERCFGEAELIAATPGMYPVLLGDPLDNFIISKLMHVRFDSSVPVAAEWALVKRYIRIVAPKLLASVGGNHEGWFKILTGVDYFQDVLAQIAPGAIYDSDDALITLTVGRAEFPIRLRHKWNGMSIWNLTHGIERAAKFDNDFICGVGAHTHASGLARQFNCNGRTGLAVLCGSYKAVDPHARERGYAKPNGSTAVTVIFDESGAMVGIDRLDYAVQLMRRLYHGK